MKAYTIMIVGTDMDQLKSVHDIASDLFKEKRIHLSVHYPNDAKNALEIYLRSLHSKHEETPDLIIMDEVEVWDGTAINVAARLAECFVQLNISIDIIARRTEEVRHLQPLGQTRTTVTHEISGIQMELKDLLETKIARGQILPVTAP
jgi:hypothetical protein